MIFTNLFKISDFEPVDLNERFVVNLYNRCLPTSTTTDYEPSTLIAKPNYFNVVDRLQFDKHKLKKEKKTIMYLMGQLRDVHKHKYLVLDHSILKYDGTQWTQNRDAELALLHLCKACDLIEPFDVGKRWLMSYYHKDIIPTLTPEDKNFKSWYKKQFG